MLGQPQVRIPQRGLSLAPKRMQAWSAGIPLSITLALGNVVALLRVSDWFLSWCLL